MDAEVAGLVGQAAPYVSTALSAYGAGVLSRAEDAAVDATANLGLRMLQLVWRRRDEQGQEELEATVQDAAEDPDDEDAAAALRQQIKRTLRDDEELRAELTNLLSSTSGTMTVTASGERAIAAQTVNTAITGDNARLQP